MKKLTFLFFCIAVFLSSCEQGGYSMRGGQFSGSKTFSVEFFKPKTPLATQAYAQDLTESFKDLMLRQSPLDLVETAGDLRFRGDIVGYTVTYAGVQSNETASSNRLTVVLDIEYINTKDEDLSFDRKSFSANADFSSEQDLFSVQEALWEELNNQLSQNIYNATVGNW